MAEVFPPHLGFRVARIGSTAALGHTRRKWGWDYAPRCGAKCRRKNGQPCLNPAMQNGRCRMHGGKNPGGPFGPANGNYKHGRCTKEALALKAKRRR